VPTNELTSDDLTQIRRQNTYFRDATRRLTEWGEKIDTIIARLELLEAAVRESSEDEANAHRLVAEQVKRLGELWLLREAGLEDSKRARKLRSEIKDENSQEHLQKMLGTVVKNLQWAQMKQARAGLNASVETLHEIEEYTSAKAEIEAQLDELKKKKKR
jgi:hypothetical protein